MTDKKKYFPVDGLKSPRFAGIRTYMRLPYYSELPDVDVAVYGVPYDTGTSYRAGARFGPSAIRDSSVILKPYCPLSEANIFEHLAVVDHGDVDIVPGYVDDSYSRIKKFVKDICDSGIIPLGMGGDHSVSLPILRGLVESNKQPIALLHFDAHSDTGSDYFGHPHNHGTPFYWALEEGLIIPEKSIQIGIRGPMYNKESLDYVRGKGVVVITGPELHSLGVEEAVRIIRERVSGAPVYVSFDIDFLDAAYAPGTGTPEIGGFTTHEALQLLVRSCLGQKLIGMDLVEVLPAHDNAGITALAGASLMHAFLGVLAKNRESKM